jgi:hypothetical protein
MTGAVAATDRAAHVEEEERMRTNRILMLPLLIVAALVAAPARPAEQVAAARAEPAQGFVPVAIWELRREGFPAVRHAWVAGSDKMLRVSYDDGVTWYGFRPVFADVARGLLALKLVVREELGRGETGWRDAAGITLATGAEGKATLPATPTAAAGEITLVLVEVKEVSPTELAPEAPQVDASAAEPNVIPMAGGGGIGSCCVSCQGVRVCDCSVCISACHTSCCLPGCFCLHC